MGDRAADATDAPPVAELLLSIVELPPTITEHLLPPTSAVHMFLLTIAERLFTILELLPTIVSLQNHIVEDLPTTAV